MTNHITDQVAPAASTRTPHIAQPKQVRRLRAGVACGVWQAPDVRPALAAFARTSGERTVTNIHGRRITNVQARGAFLEVK